jgi:hypothetical protein
VSPVQKIPTHPKEKQQSLDSPSSLTLTATRYPSNQSQHSPIQKLNPRNQIASSSSTPLPSDRSPRLISPLLKPLHPAHCFLDDEIEEMEEKEEAATGHSSKQREFSVYISQKRSRLTPTPSPSLSSALSPPKASSAGVHLSPIHHQSKHSPQNLKLQRQLHRLQEKASPSSKPPSERQVSLCSSEKHHTLSLEISSSGCGVDLDSIDQLCEHF